MPVVLLAHCDGVNGSTTFIDKSSSAHTLTPTSVTVATGNPKFGTGSAGYAFSNLASSISVGGNASDFWFDAAPFTMEAWCYATQAPSYDSPLFAEWGGALSNLGFWFSAFPTLMFFWSFDGVTYDYVDAGIGCPLNAWTHIAVDRDASGTLRVYLNGAVVASRSISGSFFHSTFTCQVGNDNTLSRPFPGYLDEVRVTKGVAQYGGAFTPPTVAFPDPGVPPTVDLAGDLAVSVALAANMADLFSLTGDFAPGISFAADLTIAGAAANYVDFTGNLGGASLYGRLAYGRGQYSRMGAFAPIFAGNFDVVGQDYFDGNIAPVVSFAGALSFVDELVGDLAPQVSFVGELGLIVDLAGDMAPQIDFEGGLGFDFLLDGTDGSFGFSVVLAASSMISGPLWVQTEPCPSPPWMPIESCPTMWTPTGPCEPVEWEDSELCNG